MDLRSGSWGLKQLDDQGDSLHAEKRDFEGDMRRGSYSKKMSFRLFKL